MLPLIDTHTHFDVDDYTGLHQDLSCLAYKNGVRHLLIIGILARYFERMLQTKKNLDTLMAAPCAHLAFGLHPVYIQEHTIQDLDQLDSYLQNHSAIAIGEIGLDTYPPVLQEPHIFEKQQVFFIEQIHLAKKYQLPILLHIRKNHAEVLKILTQQKYLASDLGGIAHSFSGGEQEALAFVKRGFKLGITGQITNPNAKKLRRAVWAVFKKYGADAFVIETDAPDMMPLPCQHLGLVNDPSNLTYVFDELASMFDLDKEFLAKRLWDNTCQALRVDWKYE